MRLGIVLAAAVAAVAAASCGSGGSTSTPAVSTSAASTGSAVTHPTSSAPVANTGPQPLTASFTGVTADTITIAVLSPDFEKIRKLFGVKLDNQDSKPVMQPLIDNLNANGGINGRRVAVVYRKFLPVGASDADRVCVEVTEDIGVFAVLGGFVGPGAQEANLCLTQLHNTILIGAAGTAQQYARSTAPWIVDSMSPLRQARALVTLLTDKGILAKKVAIWASDPQLYPLVPDVRDALKSAGSQVLFSGTQSAPASDLVASDDEYRLFLDRAQAEGVEAIYWLGNGLSPPKLGASNAPKITIYDPFADQIIGPLRNVPGVGKLTIYGVGIFPKPFRKDPLLYQCIKIVEAATDIIVTPPETTALGKPDWYTDVADNCEQLDLFRLIATAAGPDLTNDSFLAAAKALGNIKLPGEIAASIRPGKYDVSDATGLAKFDASANGKGDFVPVGPIKVFN